MIPVGLDWESHYNRASYSLSRMTVEEYVRDPRFQAIGLSIKIGFDAPAVWYARPDIEKGLATVPWEKALMIAHNCPWDGAALGWIYNLYPKAYACTLAMSRALGMNFYGGASLKAQVILANQFGADLPLKTDEVEEFDGYRYEDFNPDQLGRYGAYCNNDTTSTMGLFKWYVQSLGFPKMELAAMDEVIQMFVRPRLHLDKDLLIARLAAVRHRRDVLLERMGVTVTQVRSDASFALLLEGLGVDPPTKLSPKQKNEDGSPKEVFAFAKSDEAMKELEAHDDILVQTLVACRLKSKSTIEESRMERLIGIADRGALPVPLKYYGTLTGRVAAEGKINLCNLPRPQQPRRLDEGMLVKFGDEHYAPITRFNNTARKFMIDGNDEHFLSDKHYLAGIRDVITAPPGHLLVVCDSSQIEVRVLAWLAQQEDLVRAFANGEDIYSDFASVVFGRPVSKAQPELRYVGKVSILQLGYGSGDAKLFKALKQNVGSLPMVMDQEGARGAKEVYRRRYAHIPALWKNGGAALDAMLLGEVFDIGRPGVCIAIPADSTTPMPRVRLPNGMHIFYPGLQMTRGQPDARNFRSKNYTYLQVKGRSHVPTKIYSSHLIENLCQSLARIVVTDQWLRVKKRMIREKIVTQSPVVLHAYDELGACVPEAAAQDTKTIMLEEMSKSPDFMPGIPVAAEADIGRRYGSAK